MVSAAVLLYASLFFYPSWQKENVHSTFAWDVSGYYWYLPSVFVYHDLKGQHFGESVIRQYGFTPTFSQAFKTQSGGYVLNYSSGMALMYSPFFAMAHVLAKPLGYPADGFSKPYQAAISFGSLAVCLLGLWYFRKLLRFYFSDTVTAITIFLLAIGTNYLNYAAIDGALTHNWLFTLYVFLLLATRAFYQTFKTKYAVAIGGLCGLLILARPSEIVSVLIPLLWGMETISLSAIKARFRFYAHYLRQLLIAIVCLIAVGSIQLFYWKHVSGHWLVYSYGEQGFSWLRPHFYNYTVSYRSGWLVYTPLIVLSFIGIIPFLKYGKNKVAILAFFALNYYIVSAWDIWWYGGTGGRAMIQSYPIILFPFAHLIGYLLRHKAWLMVAMPFIVLATYMNIWFTVQAHGGEGLYDSETMTKAYYWRVAGRWHVPRETAKLKDIDELFEGMPKSLKPAYTNTLETDTSLSISTDALEGSRSIVMNPAHDVSNKYTFPLPADGADWLRAQATFHIKGKEWTAWRMTQFIVGFFSEGRIVKEKMIRVHRFLDDGYTRDIYLDVKLPNVKVDSCQIYFWNVGSEREIQIDNIKAWTFKE